MLVSAFEVLFRPGDVVVLPARYYNGHMDAIKKFGLCPALVPETPSEFVAGVRELCRGVNRPKAVVPPCSNPNGIACEADEYKELVGLAHESGFLILDDYAYGPLDYLHGFVPCSLSVPGSQEVVLWFGTASKMFSAASWKVGFVVGQQNRIAQIVRAKSIYSEGGSIPGQLAFATGLKECAEDVTITRNRYHGRARFTTQLVKQAGLVCASAPKRGMFSWYSIADFPGGSVQFAAELAKRGVTVRDDRIYGGSGTHIRWCLRVSDDDTRYAAEQIHGVLQEV